MVELTRLGEIFELKCPNCKMQAQMKILYVTPPNEPTQVIYVTSCEHCCTRDTKIELLTEKNKNGGIKIICNFNEREDMNLYLSLTRMSYLRIYDSSGDLFYEYRSIEDIHCVVESIFRKVIEDILNSYIPEAKDTIIDICNNHYNDEVTLYKKIEEHFCIDETKSDVFTSIIKIYGFIYNPYFKMEIIDNTGFSRVVPPNKKLMDMNIDDLDSFNTDKTTHLWF